MFSHHPLIRLAHAFDPILKITAERGQLCDHTEFGTRILKIPSTRIEYDGFSDLIKMGGKLVSNLHCRTNLDVRPALVDLFHKKPLCASERDAAGQGARVSSRVGGSITTYVFFSGTMDLSSIIKNTRCSDHLFFNRIDESEIKLHACNRSALESNRKSSTEDGTEVRSFALA